MESVTRRVKKVSEHCTPLCRHTLQSSVRAKFDLFTYPLHYPVYSARNHLAVQRGSRGHRPLRHQGLGWAGSYQKCIPHLWCDTAVYRNDRFHHASIHDLVGPAVAVQSTHPGSMLHTSNHSGHRRGEETATRDDNTGHRAAQLDPI